MSESLEQTPIIPVEWKMIQCTECQWIGPTEHGLTIPRSPLLSCPACSCMDSLREYTGPKSIDIPVELLMRLEFAIKTGFFFAASLKNAKEHSEYVDAQHKFCLMVWEELAQLRQEKGLFTETTTKESP